MVNRLGSEPLTVDEKIVMWHTVLLVDHDNRPTGVEVTNNPLDFQGRESTVKAQIVMHKSRSTQVSLQVARYVRRAFEMTAMSPVRRCTRAIEAKIGYACAGGYQYPPNERTPGIKLIAHIASNSIANLLKESAGGVNATRVRYTVYEVQSGTRVLRGITNKLHAVEAWWRYCPPPDLLVHRLTPLGSFQDRDKAEIICEGYERISDELWPKRPDIEYLRKIVKIDEHGEIVWTLDESPAVRRYTNNPLVCIGPRTYTDLRIKWALQTGEWRDHRRGRRSA